MSKRLRGAIYTANLLREARTILSDPNVWTKEGLFHDPDDASADTLTAPKVCAIGGICKAAKLAVYDTDEAYDIPEIQEALERLANCAPLPEGGAQSRMLAPIYMYNDGPASHQDILALFDLAIEDQCKIVREEAAKVTDADQ